MVVDAAVARVLVVDDDEPIRELVSTVLRYEGFAVEVAATAGEALAAIDRGAPDLVVLDVMLPDLDGFEVQRRVAATSRVPVLFLTARDAVEDRVRGLTLGADDYVTKPFSLEELVARVRSVLRRAGSPSVAKLVFADLEMDEDLHEVRRDGERVELTPTEFKLLRFFMRNPRKVLSKAQILDHVWEYDFGGNGNIVETYVHYLRRKIDAGHAPLIHTVRGTGYALRVGG